MRGSNGRGGASEGGAAITKRYIGCNGIFIGREKDGGLGVEEGGGDCEGEGRNKRESDARELMEIVETKRLFCLCLPFTVKLISLT